jgi:CheY-like chemotaxis protein
MSKPEQHPESALVADNYVLVVDDNPVMRQIYRRALMQQQLTVVEAESGARAVALMERVRPGYVVLDLMMLDMDGFEFLKRLRRRPEWQQVPVAVLSAKPLNDQDRAFLAANTQHYQRKSEAACAEVAAHVGEVMKKAKG